MNKRKTHEEFVKEIKQINPNIEIIEKYVDSCTYIKCRCKIDGHIWSVIPRELSRNKGCPVCANKVIVEGINDIPTTAPWMVKYFQGGYNEAKKYTCQSNKKIFPICPECGRIKDKPMYIYKIYENRSIGCVCSDKISYPEKFAYAFLKQLPILNLITQYSPDWIKPRRFDFYFEYDNQKYILEMDGGLGHGKNKWKSVEKDVVGLKNDIEKDSLAILHNITVIRIDSSISNDEYIKTNIFCNRILNDIFNLSNIDWNYCDSFAQKSILKQICDCWNTGDYTVKDLHKKFDISVDTVRRYLKKGTNLNFCDYNPKNIKEYAKPVLCNDKYAFSSKKVFQKYSEKLFKEQITSSDLNLYVKKDTYYKGIKFKFISYKDFLKYRSNHPDLSFIS